jgi:hypothetical protein
MAQQAQAQAPTSEQPQEQDELLAALPESLRPFVGLARYGLGLFARYQYQVEQRTTAEAKLGRRLTFAEQLSLPKLRDLITQEVCKAPSTAIPTPGAPSDLLDVLRATLSPEDLAVFMAAAPPPPRAPATQPEYAPTPPHPHAAPPPPVNMSPGLKKFVNWLEIYKRGEAHAQVSTQAPHQQQHAPPHPPHQPEYAPPHQHQYAPPHQHQYAPPHPPQYAPPHPTRRSRARPPIRPLHPTHRQTSTSRRRPCQPARQMPPHRRAKASSRP